LCSFPQAQGLLFNQLCDLRAILRMTSRGRRKLWDQPERAKVELKPVV
jgi:hypothetical protein